MEANLLSNRVVFVKDPTALPHGVAHHEAIDALAKNNKVVHTCCRATTSMYYHTVGFCLAT